MDLRAAVVVSMVFFVPSAALADSPAETPTRYLLRPADAPSPALKYRLLPAYPEQTSENAALLYSRAATEYRRVRLGQGDKFKPWWPWSEGPLAELPHDKIRRLLVVFQRPIALLERGALCDRCDWEFRTRAEGGDLSAPADEAIQTVAGLLILRARLDLAEGHPERALAGARSCFAVARHVADAPYLVSASAALRIAERTTTLLEEIVQSPAVPNLCWALATLPRPLVDLRRPLEGERLVVPGYLPELRNIEKRPFDAVELLGLLEHMEQTLERSAAMSVSPWDRLLIEGGLLALAFRQRSASEGALAAEGWSTARLRLMPALQLYMIDAVHEYYRLWDDAEKWVYLPFPQARDGLEAAEREWRLELVHSGPRMERFPLAAFVMFGLSGLKLHQTRLDRRLAALGCIEAIRLYAAAHDGMPPTQLTDIKDVPVPVDSFTGKPFGYQASGRRALLTGPRMRASLLESAVNLELVFQR